MAYYRYYLGGERKGSAFDQANSEKVLAPLIQEMRQKILNDIKVNEQKAAHSCTIGEIPPPLGRIIYKLHKI